MISLIDSMQARLPILRLEDNDPINLPTLLQAIGMGPGGYNHTDVGPSFGDNDLAARRDALFIATGPEMGVSNKTFNSLQQNNNTLILLGAGTPDPIIVDLGAYHPTLDEISLGLQRGILPALAANSAATSLRGLTILQATTVAKIADTFARRNNIQVSHDLLASVRAALVGNAQGVELMSRAHAFYHPDAALFQWVTESLKAMSNTRYHALRPRGVLLHGVPGTGKTAAAAYVAHVFNRPLVRLDLAAMMSKWQGEAERALRVALQSVEALSPCVMLIDEVEKVLSKSAADDTTRRMISQVLWWLQSHEFHILTIMTANDITALPPELHRDGRLDSSIEIGQLKDTTQLTLFVNGVCAMYPGMIDPSKMNFGSAPFNQAAVTRLIERAVVAKG